MYYYYLYFSFVNTTEEFYFGFECINKVIIY